MEISMPYFRRVCVGTLNTKGILVPEEDVTSSIKDFTKPSYMSVFKYTDDQYKQFQKTGTIAGIDDVVTDMLVFDFDSVDDIEQARVDTKSLLYRLSVEDVKPESQQVFFSGNKGFTVVVQINKNITPKELRSICVDKFGQGLKTLDTQIYNASRILRCPWTRHEKGLHKIPLSIDNLKNLSIDEIKTFASDINTVGDVPEASIQKFNEKWLPNLVSLSEKKRVILTDLPDFTYKPKDIPKCKYMLQNGFFKEGSRSTAFMVLGATYKNLGYPIEIVYRMLKGAAEIQAKRNGGDKFPSTELYNNIVSQIFAPTWKGGQYTCREKGSWLFDYCQSLGEYKCNHKEDNLTVKSNDVFGLFTEYANNFDKNVLYTGIESLDKRVKLMVGTTNGIVAPPGVGKTALSLQILNYNSKKDIPSIFFSYDMFHSSLYMRMLQRHSGYSQDKIYDVFKNDKKEAKRLADIINEEYKNVHFCFKSGQTAQEIKETILDVEQKIGDKVKLMVIDYSELVIADVSDMTAASAQTAQKIREIANEQQICALTLLQPAKQYSSPADDIVNFNSAKGSSSIVQSLTLLLGCSRPGFSPKVPETDKFFNITCLKNRNGALFSLDFSWDGLRGTIDEMSYDDRQLLDTVKKKREEDKAKQGGGFY